MPAAANPQDLDRNLALDLVRVTEAAAMAAGRWVGRGDKEGGDGAAVDAMRRLINSVPMRGVVVIGEGEKDNAPMLFNGEPVGDGTGPEVDVAVDPIDGTTLMSKGMPNALAVLAVARLEGGRVGKEWRFRGSPFHLKTKLLTLYPITPVISWLF